MPYVPISPRKPVFNVREDNPSDVGRLPKDIPGNLSGLRVAEPTTIRHKATGVLPAGLPGNFNNIEPRREIPYGSVGYVLMCRSVSDFTSILGIFHDYVGMGYTAELSGVGAGSVVLPDKDNPLLHSQLINGTSLEGLLEKDNLWEVYFDGERCFQWLGQNVEEVLVDGSETRGISISGPGIAETLTWALVLPNRWPDPKPKLDTLRDDFVDQDVDIYGRWPETAGTVAAANARATVTATAAGGTGSYLASAIGYDFTDSGVQALVTPYLSPAGDGKVRTHMRIEADEVNNFYVLMYTDKDPTNNSKHILVAEVKGEGGVSRTSIPYPATNPNYWRIQELDGNAIFSYRPINTTDKDWVTFATIPYTFNATSIRLRLSVNAVAGPNLVFPKSSSFSELSIDGVASPIFPLDNFRRLVLKAQARGTIKHILPTWDGEKDSMGAPWQGNKSSNVSPTIGANYLNILNDYCQSHQVDWIMGPDFRLHLRQRVWVDDGSGIPDPTAPFHKENSVIFYEGESQLDKKRTRSYKDIKNYVVGRTEGETYSFQFDADSIAKYQKRESFITDTLSAGDISTLDTKLINALRDAKDGIVSWTLTVPHDVEGKRLYADYSLGDWVSVQSTFPFRLDAWRIAAIAVRTAGDGDAEVELTLNAKLTPYWMRLQRQIEQIRVGPAYGGTGKPPRYRA